MQTRRTVFTLPVVAVLLSLWAGGTAIASIYPGLLVFHAGIALLATAMILLAWRNKTLLFAGGFALSRTETILASAGAVLFLSFVASGFVIPLLR